VKNKPKFSKFYPTGVMALVALFPAVIAMVVISEITKVSSFIFFGIWLIFAIVGEMYNEKRQKKFVDKGEIILPEHSLGKISLVFANLAIFSLIGALWLMIDYIKGLYFDGWLWFAVNFFASGIIIFVSLTLIFAGIAIYRSIKSRLHRYWLSVYSILIAGIVILTAFLFLVPLLNSVNDTLMELNRTHWEELEQKDKQSPSISNGDNQLKEKK